MWVEQPESGAFEELQDGTKFFTRVFHAELGEGRSEALDQGYQFGTVIFVDGERMLLSRIRCAPHEQAFDRVELIYANPDYNAGGSGHSDGKAHKAGDNEFTLETSEEQMSREDAVSLGFVESDSVLPEGDNVTVTVAYVIWKHWLKPKGDQRVDGRNTSAPNGFAQVQLMLNSYVHGSDVWEDGMEVNKPVSWDPKLDVSSVLVTEDSNLLLREARLRYHPWRA